MVREWNEVYRCLDKEVKKSCRTGKKRRFEEKASEAQAAADNNDPKTLYRIVCELTGARSNSNVPIKSKDGKVLLTNEDQMKRWTDHFHEVLN